MGSSTPEASGLARGRGPAREVRPTVDAHYDRLRPLCLESLGRSFDPSRQLFSRQLFEGRWTEVDAHYPHETLTSSCIALIGLSQLPADLDTVGADAERCLAAILGEVNRTGYLGGVGLVLWAAAATDSPWQQALHGIGLDSEALTVDVVPTLTSMELSWLTTGLLHQAAVETSPHCEDLARRCVEVLLTERVDPVTGLVAHAASGASLVHRARANIANFADQIYTVQALAAAVRVIGHPSAAVAAHRLASRLCDFQGHRGEWWWHYDARRGHVAQRFAVYSVHQHAMAPMALGELSRAEGPSNAYDGAILASLDWLDHNDSGRSLVDGRARTIWRSLERPESPIRRGFRSARELLGRPDPGSDAGPHGEETVTINRETRPYEWAWCLYAQSVLGTDDR